VEEQRQLGKKSQQEQLMWVQRCKTHYGTDTNWPRAGWRRPSGPENPSNVERHTEVMNQIQLLRTIARVDAALRDGPQVARVTRSQNLVLEDMDVAYSSPLNPQKKLFITSTEIWRKYLTASLKTCKDKLERQTNNQIRENRRAMDRRARKAFEDEHKGPSKFAGKRAEHRTQEELRCRVPHGLQWVERHEDSRDEMWAARLAQLQRTMPRHPHTRHNR
jgi:hypothetical protein